MGRYIAHLRAKFKESPQTAYQAVNFDKLKATTETAQLRNEVLRGTLVRAEDVDAIMVEIMISLRTRLRGFGARLGGLLAGKDDAMEITRTINEQLEALLSEYDQPIDRGEVRSRYHKLYSDIRYTLDSNRGRPAKIDAI
jgi:hypothetical protein